MSLYKQQILQIFTTANNDKKMKNMKFKLNAQNLNYDLFNFPPLSHTVRRRYRSIVNHITALNINT